MRHHDELFVGQMIKFKQFRWSAHDVVTLPIHSMVEFWFNLKWTPLNLIRCRPHCHEIWFKSQIYNYCSMLKILKVQLVSHGYWRKIRPQIFVCKQCKNNFCGFELLCTSSSMRCIQNCLVETQTFTEINFNWIAAILSIIWEVKKI